MAIMMMVTIMMMMVMITMTIVILVVVIAVMGRIRKNTERRRNCEVHVSWQRVKGQE
jgi:hypothetical protein